MRSSLVAVLLPALCLTAAPARGELYRWVDAQGRIHITDDLSEVPPRQRAAAEAAARRSAERPRSASSADPSPVHRTPPAAPARPAAGGERRHVLHVERAGMEMRVTAELDNGARVPFIVDTGAQLNTIPEWALAELDLEIDEDTPRTVVAGISGRQMLVPVITVGSVRIGTAEVDDVELAVLPTGRHGLLGMPYFNHFKIETDPTRGTLTLVEVDLDSVEGVYGGRNESAWRSKFQLIHYMIERVRSYREGLRPELEGLSEELDRIEGYWQAQLDDLELEASRAGVPRAWRE